MTHSLKVFCTGSDQERLAEQYSAVERYDGKLNRWELDLVLSE